MRDERQATNRKENKVIERMLERDFNSKPSKNKRVQSPRYDLNNNVRKKNEEIIDKNICWKDVKMNAVQNWKKSNRKKKKKNCKEIRQEH